MRRAFALAKLVLLVVVACVLFIGGSVLARGCGARLSEDIIVNPLHSSTAQIKVIGTYFGSTETRNIYRVYGTVLQDSDYATPCESGVCPNETFEIEDSFIDGNYRTADLFGMLTAAVGTEKTFQVKMRGERSGIAGTGSFRMIHLVAETE